MTFPGYSWIDFRGEFSYTEKYILARNADYIGFSESSAFSQKVKNANISYASKNQGVKKVFTSSERRF